MTSVHRKRRLSRGAVSPVEKRLVEMEHRSHRDFRLVGHYQRMDECHTLSTMSASYEDFVDLTMRNIPFSESVENLVGFIQPSLFAAASCKRIFFDEARAKLDELFETVVRPNTALCYRMEDLVFWTAYCILRRHEEDVFNDPEQPNHLDLPLRIIPNELVEPAFQHAVRNYLGFKDGEDPEQCPENERVHQHYVALHAMLVDHHFTFQGKRNVCPLNCHEQAHRCWKWLELTPYDVMNIGEAMIEAAHTYKANSRSHKDVPLVQPFQILETTLSYALSQNVTVTVGDMMLIDDAKYKQVK